MISTSTSLLVRLSETGQPEAWERFVRIYTPVLYYWTRRQGVPPGDAADLVQDVFTVLIQKLPTYQYDPRRSFAAWLRTVTSNKCRDYFRRRRTRPQQCADPVDTAAEDDGCMFTEREYQAALARQALELMQSQFEPKTWRACWMSVVEGHPAADVARELKISINAVYVAKSRVLRRLREELGGLWD